VVAVSLPRSHDQTEIELPAQTEGMIRVQGSRGRLS
jgi:hypothetical protein